MHLPQGVNEYVVLQPFSPFFSQVSTPWPFASRNMEGNTAIVHEPFPDEFLPSLDQYIIIEREGEVVNFDCALCRKQATEGHLKSSSHATKVLHLALKNFIDCLPWCQTDDEEGTLYCLPCK